MKAKKILYLVACMAIFCSCNKKKEGTDSVTNLIEIHINPDKLNEVYDIRQDIDPQWEIVALETNDSCLITGANDVIFTNNMYYILDRKGHTVFLFDAAGKYVSKLYKRGQGPGEYVNLSAMAIQDKNIWITDDHLNTLLCYNQDYTTTHRFNMSDYMGPTDMMFMDNNIYMATNWEIGRKKNMQFGKYNIKDDKITGLYYVPDRSKGVAFWRKQRQLAQSKGSILCIQSYCDTIFEIADETFAPKYKMLFSARYEDIPRTNEEVFDPKNANIIKGIEDIKQTQHKIFIGYGDDRYLRSAIYDKTTGECNVYEQIINPELGGLNIYQTSTFFNPNEAIAVYEPDSFVEFFKNSENLNKIKNEADKKQIETLIASLNEDSNPILIKYTLK